MEIAAFIGFPRALTFSTGYLANLAVTPTLAGRGDAVFADKLNHASLIDAMQLAKAQGAETQRYPHNDMATLEKMLAASGAATKIIVSDAVFSMDGDLAPLPLLFALAEQYDAWLVIDDAHGFGVLGAHGQGSLAHFNLPASPRILLMGTLGKAAGVGGAFIAGSANRHRIPAAKRPQLYFHHGDATRHRLRIVEKPATDCQRRCPARQPDGAHCPVA
jgi:8-amino-7-oxononanoate synthase